MHQVTPAQFGPGRWLAGRLPDGQDLARSVEAVCRTAGILMARFSVSGIVSSVTLGAFDAAQQVYVTDTKEGAREIVSCSGTVSVRQGRPEVRGQILVADTEGRITGGRLFSESRVLAAEIEVLEMKGPPLERAYNESTGLWLWP